MGTRWSRVLIGGAVVSILLGAGTVITLADTGGVIFACVNNANGDVRIVAQQVSCKNNETAAHWNIVGPQGPAGPQGPSGPAGPAGPAGPPGQSGPLQQVVGVVTVHATRLPADQHFQAIEFTSGITAPTTATGRVTLQPATVTKVIDKSSPLLAELLATDATATVTVDLCNTTTMSSGNLQCSGTPYAIYTYEDAKLTKVQATASPMFTNFAEEDVTVNYVRLTYRVDGNTFRFDSATGRVG